MDPRKSNGGVFLGLNGIVIKSHGGTDDEGFASAIDMGYDMVRYELARQDRRVAWRATCRQRATAARGERSHLVTFAFGGAWLRLLSAGAHSHQRRTGASRSTPPTNGSCSAPASASAISRRAGELTSDLALHAARAALANAKVEAESIDLIVLATSTPDKTFPATAVSVQAGLGITSGAAFDLQAVCSGFVYALSVVDAMLKSRRASSARW